MNGRQENYRKLEKTKQFEVHCNSDNPLAITGQTVPATRGKGDNYGSIGECGSHITI